jgi:predicted ATP-grasp superfamily ATP-dependent carboligase
MNKLPAAFVTYGWCRVSYTILDSLARRGAAVHIGDASGAAMCRWSRRAASFARYRSPYREPEGFVDDIAAAMRRARATVLLPGHEDILVLSRLRQRLPPEIILPVDDADKLARSINKWQVIGLARAAGVPVPESFKPDTAGEVRYIARELRYPAIVKTQLGNSAKGVFVVNSAEEAVTKYESVIKEYNLAPTNWPVLQEFARGTGYGVCLLYNRGQFRASFAEKYLRCKEGNFGTSTFRESVAAPELIEMGRALLDSLNWHGVAHLDFIYDEATKKTALIEINPRFWGALDLSVRAGVDFPWLLYKMAVEGDVETVTEYKRGVRARWVVGEMLHLFNLAKRLRVGGLLRSATDMLTTRADGCDDFRWRDPLALPAEMFYYGSRFIVTGSTNPVEEGMIG